MAVYGLEERFEKIERLVRGKRVLDCGAAMGIYPTVETDRSILLHDKISRAASYVLGIDSYLPSVTQLRSEGYNVVFGDVEQLQLSEKFDIVVAGELIEHLSNPGKFLEAALNLMEPQGKLILTTPNVYGITEIIRNLFGEGWTPDSHVACYSERTLTNLLCSNGYAVKEVNYCVRASRSRFVAIARSFLCKWRPGLCDTLLVVAEAARRTVAV